MLWLWFAPLVPHIDDELAHVRLAQNIVAHGQYAFDPGQPTSLRPPLYPAFLAAVFAVAGDQNYQAVRLIQSLLSLVTVVILYRLTRDLISERAGLRAAGMLAFYPTFLGFNNLMLTEVVFTFFLVAGISAVSRGLHRNCYSNLAAAGVLLGLGALTRSVLFPFAPVLGLFLFAVWQGSIVRRTLAALAFIVPFAATLTPWAVRNTRLHKTLVVVDCMGGRNFMMGNYEYTPLYRSWDAISIRGEREWIQVLLTQHPNELKGVTQGQVDKLAFKDGLQFVRDNPGLTLERDIIKFFDFWGLERELVAGAESGLFGDIPRSGVLALGVLICGAYVIVLFAGAFGAALAPPKDLRQHLLLLLIIAFVCAVHTVVFAHSRYHLPIMPFVMVYAAAAFGAKIWSRRGQLTFWLAAAFCMMVVTGWIWNMAAGDAGKLIKAIGLGS
jgi:4-amino-4-deoxy-L-arabinose transferase-like glycosyltransferase